MTEDWEEVREVGEDEVKLLEKLDQKLTEGASQYGNFNRRYLLRKTIGTGGYSVVKEGRNRETGDKVAIKILNLSEEATHLHRVLEHNNESTDGLHQPFATSRKARGELICLLREVELLRALDHPVLNKLLEYYVAPEANKVYLVLELVEGGELLVALQKRQHYSEADAQKVVSRVLSGLAYMHERGIVHRDLKLENLMLADENDLSSVRIVDFGLAKALKRRRGGGGGRSSISAASPDGLWDDRFGIPAAPSPAGAGRASCSLGSPGAFDALPSPGAPSPGVGRRTAENSTLCGTPQYMAPEMIIGASFGPAADIWSLGVITHLLLTGQAPFLGADAEELFDSILRHDCSFAPETFEGVSQEAVELVQLMLSPEAAARPTARQLLEHRWTRGEAERPARPPERLPRASAALAGEAHVRELHGTARLFREGEYLFQQGEAATSVFLIRRGRCRSFVLIPPPQQQEQHQPQGAPGPGAWGEGAEPTEAPAAEAMAEEESVVVVIEDVGEGEYVGDFAPRSEAEPDAESALAEATWPSAASPSAPSPPALSPGQASGGWCRGGAAELSSPDEPIQGSDSGGRRRPRHNSRRDDSAADVVKAPMSVVALTETLVVAIPREHLAWVLDHDDESNGAESNRFESDTVESNRAARRALDPARALTERIRAAVAEAVTDGCAPWGWRPPPPPRNQSRSGASELLCRREARASEPGPLLVMREPGRRQARRASMEADRSHFHAILE